MIVINAEKVEVTGKKAYKNYTEGIQVDLGV